MDLLALNSVILVVICYFAADVYKTVVKNTIRDKKKKENLIRLIPTISSGIGIVLAIFCYYCLPEVINADTVGHAIATGIMSGMTATGTNQIFKQVSRIETSPKE